MPKEVEALRASLDSRLSALEKALADPAQHGRLEPLILELSRITTQEAVATARQAVLDAEKAGQQALEAARTETAGALEAQKVEAAALHQVIEGAKQALRQAETALKEQRKASEAANHEAAAARREMSAIQEQLEQEQSARARQSRELDEARHDSNARTQMLAQSEADQEAAKTAQEALRTVEEAVRSAEARLEEAILERDTAQNERLELERRLEEAEHAIRESEAARRELQAAHEARDAAEVIEASRHAEREVDAEAFVDLTSITREEDRLAAIEQRTRALELALRDAERRAEAAELELDIRRRSSAPSLSPLFSSPLSSSSEEPAEETPRPAASEATEQFRGPARGARRVTFNAEIAVQIDGNPGKLVDLSMTGAQLLTPSTVSPNRLVTVTLPLGDGAMACKAKVAWSRLEPRSGQLWYRAGVQFTSADPEGLETFLRMYKP